MSGRPDAYGPRLEMAALPVARLFVDPRYQRACSSRTSRDLIDRIAGGFQWSRFGAAAVMPWPERDGWAILDGQHRIEAARLLGIETVPCLVHPAMAPAAAAAVFVGVNLDRIAMTPMALHHARVAAGDPAALTVARVCADAGVEIARYAMHVKEMKPGQTFAAGTLYKALRVYGEAPLLAALSLLAAAFRAQKGRLKAELILGITSAFARSPRGNVAALEALLSETASSDLAVLVDGYSVDGKGLWAAVRDLALETLRTPVKAAIVAAPPEPVARPTRAGEDSKPPASDRAEAKKRTCLGCGRDFPSEWVGNRLCRSCRGRSPGIAA